MIRRTKVAHFIQIKNQTGFDVEADMISEGADAMLNLALTLHDKWKTSVCIKTDTWRFDAGITRIDFDITIFDGLGDCLQYSFKSPYDLAAFVSWLIEGDSNVTPSP